MTFRTVADVMTPNVVSVPPDASVRDAALRMREFGIGDVLVVDHGILVGLVTDRDLTVRSTADGRDSHATPVREVCSMALLSVRADTPLNDAVELMRAAAVRRLPVVAENRPVGIVSIGDLAIAHNQRSALAGISVALSNT